MPAFTDQLIHAENAEMVMRIAGVKGLPFPARDLGDGWMQAGTGDGQR